VNSLTNTSKLRSGDARAPAPLPPLPLRIMIVNDDLAIRLRLADLLTPHCPGAVIDSCSRSAAVGLGARLREYTAAIVITDMAPAGPGEDPLAIVANLRSQSRALIVTVIGRGGHERSAVDALRAGAADYWALHNVDARELVGFLRAQFLSTSLGMPGAAGETGPFIAGYRLVKELARSTQATLYLAHSDELDQPVAIKVHRHHERAESSDEEQERFLRECRLLSQLNHRAIADVYDFGVTDECHWLAMEYFPCGSLKARLQNPVAEPEAIAYALQVGAALKVVHAAGIVHRDLKPSNIMLRADDSIALIDFGLARPTIGSSDLTAPNVRVGSPSYMAPEQVQGTPPDARCDLYALGVLLYELLTGELPFRGTTIAAMLDQHLHAPVPVLPEPLKRYQPIIERLLAKKPEQRFDSADGFLEALAEAGGDPPARRKSR
jgi:serine/threonine-protein kinase PpkA